jgi:chromosome segregation protein
MDAADVLYGVSMGGDGVTKVVSRRLPREVGEDAEDEGEAPGLSAVA